MPRTELQYNLQKARALATELRSTLEELGRYPLWDTEEHLDQCNVVGELEDELDNMSPEDIGEGHVAFTIEPFGGSDA